MKNIGWHLESDGKQLDVYHIDPHTHAICRKETLKFSRPKTFEDAYQFVRANYLSEETYESIGQYVA